MTCRCVSYYLFHGIFFYCNYLYCTTSTTLSDLFADYSRYVVLTPYLYRYQVVTFYDTRAFNPDCSRLCHVFLKMLHPYSTAACVLVLYNYLYNHKYCTSAHVLIVYKLLKNDKRVTTG